MSNLPSQPTIAYLAQGKIRLKSGDAPPRSVESVYGNSIREKAIRAQQKHSWKGQGDSSPFAAAWGDKAMQGGEVPLIITSLCASKESGSLIYSLESGSLCALLEVRQLGAEEQRLWNDNNTRIRHVTVSKQTGDMVFSILHQNGTANIGVKRAGRSGYLELTEGDSFDTAPRWKSGDERFITYQSAGVGRNRDGHFLAFGPFTIQQLDTEVGEIATLVEVPGEDCLAPHVAPYGSLYYIQRPYVPHESPGFFSSIKNLLMFPFRLAHAIYNFLNFFSAIFSGRKLSTGGGAKAREMDMKQMMIWGNLVRSQKQGEVEDESADLVPKSWQLMRRSANGETTALASGVLAYDVGADGTVVYTNGNAVFLLHPDGRKQHIVNERMIEQVFLVSA
ncbi:MAG: hypothetical protein AAB370_07045 [Verrucomicrobiota bacterium]